MEKEKKSIQEEKGKRWQRGIAEEKERENKEKNKLYNNKKNQ